MSSRDLELKTRKGHYSVVRVRVPQEDIQTVGILLVDENDQLHYRLSDFILGSDDDVLVVWEATTQMLRAMADELGGMGTLQFLANTGAHFLEISPVISINMADPKSELLHLYDQHVLPIRLQAGFEGLNKIGRSAIETSCSTLPNISSGCIDMLRRYRGGELGLEHLERLLERDPIVSGQVVRLANLAAYSRGAEIRSVRQALSRVGTEAAFGFIMALSFKPLYSSPSLRAVWNLAVRCRTAAVLLAQKLKCPNVEEIGLLALVADVGKIVFFNIPEFEQEYTKLRAFGYRPLGCEAMLTGTTHAEISASILENWSFPQDMTNAIRFHHTPSDTSGDVAALLYFSECSLECADVECDLEQFYYAADRLKSSTRDLSDHAAQGVAASNVSASSLLMY